VPQSAEEGVVQRETAPRNYRLRWPPVAQLTLALLLVGVLWRTLRYALGFPIWGDEAFVAVDFVVRDFGDPVFHLFIVKAESARAAWPCRAIGCPSITVAAEADEAGVPMSTAVMVSEV
jgi:hypothetical protein